MAQPRKKTNPSHQQQIARALNRACGCGYQEALRRVTEASRKGLLPPVLDQAGRARAVEILLAAHPALLDSPTPPLPLAALAPWATRAQMTLHHFTPLLAATLVDPDPEGDAHHAFTSYLEEADSDDVAAAWLYLGAGCIAGFDHAVGRHDPQQQREALDRLEQQTQEHWRALVGAVDFEDGFTTAEEVFQRDVWDLPTMAILAGVPVDTLPETLRAWARACGSVAAGDADRALLAFDRARGHRFSSDLAQIQVTTMFRALKTQMTLTELVDYSKDFADALIGHHIAAAAADHPDAQPAAPSAAEQER